MLSTRTRLHDFGLFLVLSASTISFCQKNQSSSAEGKSQSVSAGRGTFNDSCAACHGLDGRGSDKALNIAANSRAQHLSNAQLAKIISNGVPENGMPAFNSLSASEIDGVVRYLRTLQGKSEAQSLPGDAQRGRAVFFGKGDCASCHMIAGEGGFLGPDLTNYSATASPDGIRNEIVRSTRVPSVGYRTAVITTAKSDRLEGLIRNEDNFSLQLQTKDGTFHLLKKADVQSRQTLDGSLMPADYRDRLNESELNDLVSYLMKTPDPRREATLPMKKGDFE
jgi:putative heme-binding domain-containing protein